MTTYIFGHKSPDTDTVCSSIALSYLKNALGEKTTPKVLGNINNETKFVLKYFGVLTPSYLNDVRVRIKNVKYNRGAFINENASIDEAFKLMQKENITAVPLINTQKILTGYITLKEIAKFLISGSKECVETTLKNIVKTLEASVLLQFDEFISGNIIIAGMQSNDFFERINLTNDDILIVGDRYRILEYAINCKVKLIILPLHSKIDDKLIEKAKQNKINIIETSFSSYQIANKMLLSNYIKSINTNNNPITVNNEDYYSDFKQMTHQINHTNYPVVNNKGECLGLIRLTGPNTFERQKVILVDHNNLVQSVDGIEEAEILEIIDHHNLGAIGTNIPINFQSKPVGCTSTMIYDMYVDNGIVIPKDIAGIMLSSILSDTLLLTSPTTTELDKFVAIKLAYLAKVNIDEFGLKMLKAASSIKELSINEIIMSDFKSYNLDNKMLGLGQVMTMEFDYIEDKMDEFVQKINEMEMNNYSIIALFFTDVIKQGSYVLYNKKAENIIKESFGLKEIKQGIFIPRIISRKKQILPSIMSTVESDTI